ncbi:MAG: cupin domain-containing protein [bacterium]|nr:cupin domain-containing protein [bacterium]
MADHAARGATADQPAALEQRGGDGAARQRPRWVTSVFPGHFHTKEQAIAEIMRDGYWPVSWIDKPGSELGPHLHRGDETLYVVDGSLDFCETETGETHHLEAGDKLVLPARLPHSASTTEGATYIMGIKTLVSFDEHILPAT